MYKGLTSSAPYHDWKPFLTVKLTGATEKKTFNLKEPQPVMMHLPQSKAITVSAVCVWLLKATGL